MASILDYNKMLSSNTASKTNVQKAFPGATYSSTPQRTSGGSSGGSSNSGSSSGGSGDSNPMSSVSDMISKYQAAQDAYNSKASDYYKNNPFNYDDMLKTATTEATAAVSPYYTTLLNNFMAGVNHTRQTSLEDENRAVTQLQADSDAYTGQAKANLQSALLGAGQQYSDAGSYDSGARARTQGVQSVNSAYDIGNEQRQTGYNIGTQNLAGERLRNFTLPLQTSQENLELSKEKTADINQTAAQDYQNNVANYEYNAQKQIGAPPGQDTIAFQNNISTLLPYVNQAIPSTQQ